MVWISCFFFALFARKVTCEVTYVPGNANIVITASHGGRNKDIGCPDRINGCKINGECLFDSRRLANCPDEECAIRTLGDINTLEIAQDLVDAMTEQLGATPHLVTMGAHRRVIDANREINEACMGCASCETLYKEYHAAIASAISAFDKGILFDIHGQAHEQNSTELGYAIDKRILDEAVAGKDLQSKSTIDALLSRSGLTLKELLFGPTSLGALLQSEGFDALPSPTIPTAGNTDYKYFSGGFTVRTYHKNASVDAIQIEAPGEVRKTDLRQPYTKALAKALTNFYLNFGYQDLSKE